MGYVSEDLWKDLFGPLPRTTSSADAEDEEGTLGFGAYSYFLCLLALQLL